MNLFEQMSITFIVVGIIEILKILDAPLGYFLQYVYLALCFIIIIIASIEIYTLK